ncbi:tellurite resistance domain protein [Pectobacterium polaris]|uniref:tellurite resistance domain protein n=1 Tax=Pectobacterium polaris TaxID=2042057 RepID=UPI002405DACC|nr:tellurite resistance domain protein [Pectobacterium polaris]MDG0803613.1 tellurite resistance domain protein [Pectobacterium polaris]
MQRLIISASIDDSTLATYEETVAIIHRHLPPSLALLYATARRSAEGNLEWWTERQGLAIPQSTLSDAEQLEVQKKRQQYQDTVAGLNEQLKARGEEKAALALQTLLTHSQKLTCYSVGGEPVLINWAIPVEETPAPVAVVPWWRRFLPWLLLFLLLLTLAAWWWFFYHKRPDAALPVPNEAPAEVTAAAPENTQLTSDNPSTNLAKRKDFGRIKINLTWQQGQHRKPVDLDLAAFVRLKDGKKSGIEVLSKLLGNYDTPPFMLLPKDLRGGNDQDGEWLFINGSKWQEIDEVLIYSFIYDGTDNWQGTDATITLYVPDQLPIRSTLVNGSERNNVAAIARLKNVDGDIKVERLNNFFRDRESLDKHYGWGFEWTPGASKN